MPRVNGVYNLPSPPAPLLPNTLASAGDVMTLLTDIGAALTQSVATDGTSNITGPTNFNNQNVGGISNLGVGTVNAAYVSTPSASIGALAGPLNANGQNIDGVGELGVSGTANLYGPLSVTGAANFFGGLSVDAGLASFFGGVNVDAGPLNVFAGALIYGLNAGGGGVIYSGIMNGTATIGFGWDGNAVSVWVNGQDVGYIPPYALTDRLTQLEARIAELENELARVAAHA